MLVSVSQEVTGLIDRALCGERSALARLLSKIEREHSSDVAQLLLGENLGQAHILGVTGPPGAGKSSLINSLLPIARQHFDRIAVLAIDPSSPFSHGALLGDRVRMQGDSLDDSVFIRSMASRGDTGGLARAAFGAITAFDACGWPLIIIETLGIGQVELDIVNVADTVLVVLNPGWGDVFQANKAGITESGNVFAINKCDRPGADKTRQELEESLRLLHADQCPRIVETVATSDRGADDLWQVLLEHQHALQAGGHLEETRADKRRQLFRKLMVNQLIAKLDSALASGESEPLLADMMAGVISIDDAVHRLLQIGQRSGHS